MECLGKRFYSVVTKEAVMIAEVKITITGSTEREIREKAKRIINAQELDNTNSRCRIAESR